MITRVGWAGSVALVFLMLAMGPSTVQAQPWCGKMEHSFCENYAHWMTYEPDAGWTDLHFDCRICLGTCHEPCAQTEDDEDREEVLAAGVDGDREQLLRFAQAGSDWLVFNLDRQALEILSCSRKSVVAHLPLSAEEVTKATSLVEAGLLLTIDEWERSLVLDNFKPMNSEETRTPA